MTAIDRRTALAGLGTTVALAAAPALAQGQAFVPARDPRLTIEGRTAFGPDGALRIGYPGVALHFIADAPHVTMRARATTPDVWIDISVDGGAPRVVHLAQGAQDIPLSATPGRHRYMILKRTESWQGILEVEGFGGVARIALVALPSRRLMFIGDSITCGASADVTRDDPGSGTETNDGAKSFGRVLAAKLNAQCHLVSYGGRGVYRDWQGIEAIVNAPTFYERALADDPHALWDPRRSVPHAIGICLGTNDFNQGVPDQKLFTNAYVEFIDKIRRDAPAAHIFVIDSPMTIDSDELGHRRTIQHDYIDQVVRRLDTPLVTRAPIAHYPGRKSNSHPIAEEHIAIAAELEPHFRAATGWVG